MFACEHANITSDFISLSKGITGGYLPLSAVLTTDEVYDAFYHDATSRGFLHSHSYTGNPLACSAALATLRLFETEDMLNKNEQKSEYIINKMQVLTDLPIIHLRHQGMIFAFDVDTKNPMFAQRCYAYALDAGLLIRPIGNTVYFMPPYVIREAEIDLMIQATYNAVEKAL